MEANEVVRPLHDRMPVILSPDDDHEAWLSPDSKKEDLCRYTGHWRRKALNDSIRFEVRTLVNKVANESPEKCV